MSESYISGQTDSRSQADIAQMTSVLVSRAHGSDCHVKYSDTKVSLYLVDWVFCTISVFISVEGRRHFISPCCWNFSSRLGANIV